MARDRAGAGAGRDDPNLDPVLLQGLLQLRASSGFTPSAQCVEITTQYTAEYLDALEQKRVAGTLQGDELRIYNDVVVTPQFLEFARGERQLPPEFAYDRRYVGRLADDTRVTRSRKRPAPGANVTVHGVEGEWAWFSDAGLIVRMPPRTSAPPLLNASRAARSQATTARGSQGAASAQGKSAATQPGQQVCSSCVTDAGMP